MGDLISPLCESARERFLLHLNHVPEEIALEIRTPYARVQHSFALVPQKVGEPKKVPVNKISPPANSDVPAIFTMSIDTNNPETRSAIDNFKLGGVVEYSFYFNRLPFIDLQRVQIGFPKPSVEPGFSPKAIEGSDLLQNT